MEHLPVCHWFFDRQHRFAFVSGESPNIFHAPPAELAGHPVPEAAAGLSQWPARLAKAFCGEALLEKTALGYTVVHLPVRDAAGRVSHVAGFAYAQAQSIPALAELESLAVLILRAVEAERARAAAFLHDVVAQTLGGVGLQAELLRQHIDTRGGDPTKLAGEISAMQTTLDDAFERIRRFISTEEEKDGEATA